MKTWFRWIAFILTYRKFYGALLVTAIPVVLLWFGIARGPELNKMAAYPSLKADVTHVYKYEKEDFTHVHKYDDDEDDDDIQFYAVHVKFELDGKEYSRAVDTRWRPGKTVTVKYNPENPDDFHLAWDSPPGQLQFLCLAGIFGVIALLVVYSVSGEMKTEWKARKAKNGPAEGGQARETSSAEEEWWSLKSEDWNES